MGNVFFIMFGVGVGFVLLNVLFEGISGLFSFEFGGGLISPMLLAIFVTALGGLGLIFYPTQSWWVALSWSFLVALALSWLVFRYVWLPLHKWQNTSTHDRQSLVGHPAKIAETIPQGGYGKIRYSINDKIVTGPAKAESSLEIKKGSDVLIVFIEKNTYFVREV